MQKEVKVKETYPAEAKVKERALSTVREVLEKYPFVRIDEVVFDDPADYPDDFVGMPPENVGGWFPTGTTSIYINYRFSEGDTTWVEDGLKVAYFASDEGVSVRGLILHEVGHYLLSWKENTRINGRRLRTLVREYYNKREVENIYEEVSILAGENYDEYFAEVFVKYNMDKDKCTEDEKEVVEMVLGKWSREKK